MTAHRWTFAHTRVKGIARETCELCGATSFRGLGEAGRYSNVDDLRAGRAEAPKTCEESAAAEVCES